jgi:hypothetical protein
MATRRRAWSTVRGMFRAVVPAALALAGCGDTLEPAEIDPDCAPLYEPTFANVHAQTLRPDCALGGCHSEQSARGELALADPDTAHQHLLDPARPRVIPGDPAHSELVMRLYTRSSDFLMPPGGRLAESERCAVALWVLQGAPR